MRVQTEGRGGHLPEETVSLWPGSLADIRGCNYEQVYVRRFWRLTVKPRVAVTPSVESPRPWYERMSVDL